jgi:hypothetical protein
MREMEERICEKCKRKYGRGGRGNVKKWKREFGQHGRDSKGEIVEGIWGR